jgi:hypothetical protein
LKVQKLDVIELGDTVKRWRCENSVVEPGLVVKTLCSMKLVVDMELMKIINNGLHLTQVGFT